MFFCRSGGLAGLSRGTQPVGGPREKRSKPGHRRKTPAKHPLWPEGDQAASGGAVQTAADCRMSALIRTLLRASRRGLAPGGHGSGVLRPSCPTRSLACASLSLPGRCGFRLSRRRSTYSARSSKRLLPICHAAWPDCRADVSIATIGGPRASPASVVDPACAGSGAAAAAPPIAAAIRLRGGVWP